MIECAGGLLGLPVFLHYGNRIGEGGLWGSFFGRSASWHRLVIPIYFMYGNRMMQILPERYAYSEISGTSILI